MTRSGVGLSSKARRSVPEERNANAEVSSPQLAANVRLAQPSYTFHVCLALDLRQVVTDLQISSGLSRQELPTGSLITPPCADNGNVALVGPFASDKLT
jgi:hypothetical protein